MLKKIFFSLLLIFSFVPFLNAQWWVSGGNVIWPYGDVSVTNGSIISSKYEHIILWFNKNGDDQEFNLTIYRNDTGTSVDTVYWSGGAFGINYFVEFSNDIIDASSQTLYYYVSYIDTCTNSSYAHSTLHAQRSGFDNRILLTFIGSDGNAVDLFTGSVYVDLIIVPIDIIDSYNTSW